MRMPKTLLLGAVPALTLGACTMSLNDQDRAMLTSASENAQQAKNLAQQALTAANNASQTASQAAKDA